MIYGNLNETQKAMMQQQLLSQYLMQQQMAMQQAMTMNGLTPAQKQVQLEQRTRPKVRRTMYMELRVTNNNLTQQDILLWDAIGAYQLQNNYTPAAGITIELTTKSGSGSNGYLLLLNKLASGSTFYFNALNMEVTNQLQFGRSISFYDDSQRADNVSLYDSVFPSQFRNSMQRQLNLLEMPKDYKVGRTTSWLYTQEANSTVIYKMEVEEEVSSNS